MPLLKMTKSTIDGDIVESLSSLVYEHEIGQQTLILWITCAKIEVEISIVVEVPEIGTHRQYWLAQSGASGNLVESATAIAAVETALFVGSFDAQASGANDTRGSCIAARVDIENSIIVEVPEPNRKATAGSRHTERYGDIRE